MAPSTIKKQYYQELSRVTHAISHSSRMELIDVLSQGSHSVEELSKEIGMSLASTSQHLQVLKSARLVDTTREGNYIIYRISEDSVISLVMAIKELGARRLAEIDRLVRDFKSDQHVLESITLEDLIARSKKEKMLLIDVRPQKEYLEGHIPNAVSVPLSDLNEKMKDLPRDKTIIAYCRGPLCVMASEAVKILKKNKFRAIGLEQGYVEWKLGAGPHPRPVFN